jgi:hypothetical protein
MAALLVSVMVSTKNAAAGSYYLSSASGTQAELKSESPEMASESQARAFFFWAGITLAAVATGFLGTSATMLLWQRRKARELFSVERGEDV